MNKQTHLSDDFIDSGIVSREQWPYGSPYASCIRPYASCYDPVIALVEEGEDHDNGDIDDEFSVLVSLEEFMKEFRTLHHGRGAASVMGKPSVIY